MHLFKISFYVSAIREVLTFPLKIMVQICFFRESRRKTPNAVAFKDKERHFSDPALNVVSLVE